MNQLAQQIGNSFSIQQQQMMQKVQQGQQQQIIQQNHADKKVYLQQQLLEKSGVKKGDIIREVWADNLEREFQYILDLAEDCAYIALDTEFPGCLVQTAQSEYQKIKINVEGLSMIQLGLTFARIDGTFPNFCTFQFNFSFNKEKEFFNKEAIRFLEDSGIQFKDHARKGIQLGDFAELMFGSNLLFNENFTWITFHGNFDFAYFLKILIDVKLPSTCKEFYEYFRYFFPQSIDVKVMIQEYDNWKFQGLEKLSKSLDLERIGPQHQAGSDSLLTMKTYFKLKQIDKINKELKNTIYGLLEFEDDKQLQMPQQQSQQIQQNQQFFDSHPHFTMIQGQEPLGTQFYFTPAMDYYQYEQQYMGNQQNQMYQRNFQNNSSFLPSNEQRGGQPRRTPSGR